jgi:hypothetical protein
MAGARNARLRCVVRRTTASGASAERATSMYSGASEFWFEYKLMNGRLYNCLSSHTLFSHTLSLLRPL